MPRFPGMNWNKVFTHVEYQKDDQVRGSTDSDDDVPDWEKVPQTTINNYTYLPNMVQYLIEQKGWNPSGLNQNPIDSPCGMNTQCQIQLGSTNIKVDSIILFFNGLSSLVQTILLTTIGSLADYGNNGSNILLIITIVSCASQIVFLVFNENSSDYWGLAMMVCLIFQVSYGASLTFYWAYFPTLAANEPKVRTARHELGLDNPDYQVIESTMRNHISTVSTAWSNIGFFSISIILIGAGFGLAAAYHTEWQKLPAYSNSIFSAICGCYWLLFSIPWFVFQKHRPGPPLPTNANYLTFGWKTVGAALREYKRLPQTFIYLIGYFLLNDAISSTSTLTQILSNRITNFDGVMQTYFNLVQSVCSIIGCFVFLYVQKYLGWSARTMLLISTGTTLLIPVWGCIGIASTVVGFRQVAELWVYQAWFGLFTAPFYAYSQTIMSELIPTGHENMFFGLFGITGKLSQFFGPLIVSSITETTDVRKGFIVCAICQLLPLFIIGYIDMGAAEMHIKVYEEQERRKSCLEDRPRSSASSISVYYHQKEDSNEGPSTPAHLLY
ncbi:autophagy-related protein 22-like protein [Phycomyces nitens]|nr:autophagy-related protein 22-like protein [Phycomyces nitens]